MLVNNLVGVTVMMEMVVIKIEYTMLDLNFVCVLDVAFLLL